jgi:hypothetical protein
MISLENKALKGHNPKYRNFIAAAFTGFLFHSFIFVT